MIINEDKPDDESKSLYYYTFIPPILKCCQPETTTTDPQPYSFGSKRAITEDVSVA